MVLSQRSVAFVFFYGPSSELYLLFTLGRFVYNQPANICRWGCGQYPAEKVLL